MGGHESEKLNRPGVSDPEEVRVYTGSAGKKRDTMPFSPVTGDTVSFSPPGKKGDTMVFPSVKGKGRKPSATEDTAAFSPVKEKPRKASAGRAQAAAPSGTAQTPFRKGDTAVFRTIGADTPLPGQSASSARSSDAPKIRPVPLPREYTPQQLLEKYRSGLLFQSLRLYLLALAALFGIFLLTCQSLSLELLPGLEKYSAAVALSALGLALLLGIEVPIRGFYDLLRARISTYTLTTLAALLGLIQGMTALPSNGQTYCLPLLLLVFFQEYSLVSHRSGMYRTLRTVCSFEAPTGIYSSLRLLPDTASLHRGPGKLKDYVTDLLQPDFPRKAACCYATVLLPLTTLLAVLFAVKTSVNFLLLWLLLLTASIPCAAMLTYSLPMRILAKRLASQGGALCGWHGARLFDGKHTLILRDEDLFPRGDFSSNGMKLFNGYRAEDVIPLAVAAAKLTDSPLTDLLRSLLTAPAAKPPVVTDSRIYDNNGVGAEINGDVILAGTLSFMRSMGVHMPSGTRVRQALYLSINGELAGIIAIRYKANPSTGAGLKQVLANRNFSVVLATRDFLITPELIAAKYELPTDSLVFPKYTERLRLSDQGSGDPASQGGLIAGDTFGAFAMTVAAGRTLRSVSCAGLWMNLLAGLLGLLLCLLLIYWGAVASITPIHLAAFQLLWAGMTMLISFILVRF